MLVPDAKRNIALIRVGISLKFGGPNLTCAITLFPQFLSVTLLILAVTFFSHFPRQAPNSITGWTKQICNSF